jgi:DNA-binding transcriptional LysR family regulator
LREGTISLSPAGRANRTRRHEGSTLVLDWDKLRIFHAVADAGSLTHAGDTLHLSQSAVSRQIRALEENLNTTLFHRHARGLILTEQGELLFDATRHMSKRLDAAAARIRDSEEEVFGELRVTTTIGFGSLWLAPRLPALYEKYPDLKIDLMLEERLLDLPMREADVAIRMKEPSQADLIRRRLMSINMRLYASPRYIEAKGMPETLDDLRHHRLISQNATSAQVSSGAILVRELMSYDIGSHLTVNNYFGVLQGVIHDLGIGVLPDYLTQDFPDLVRVLPDVQSGEVPVFLAYPEELRQSKRVEVFRDFVTEEVIAYRRRKKEAAEAEAETRNVSARGCALSNPPDSHVCYAPQAYRECGSAAAFVLIVFRLLPISASMERRRQLQLHYLPVGLWPRFVSAFFLGHGGAPWFPKSKQTPAGMAMPPPCTPC